MTRSIKWKAILFGKLTLKRLAISILEIYVLLTLFAYFFADSLIFQVPDSSYQDSEKIIKLTSSRNNTISALYLPYDQAKFTILYSHGNAEDLSHIKPWLQELQNLGFNIFAYDYQGYGTSKGRATEQNTYADIKAAYHYLTDEVKIPPKQIILYGRSVGSGISLELAKNYPVGGLILESSFISAYRVRTVIPLLPFDKFNNLKKIGQVQAPIILIHGTSDQIIPLWHSEQLFQIAPEPKHHLWIEGAGHNDLHIKSADQIKQAISNFVKKL